MIFLALLCTIPALPASSSPSQLLPNLPALLLLAQLVFFFRICNSLVSICCKLVGLVLSQSGSHGETRWTSTRRAVGGNHQG